MLASIPDLAARLRLWAFKLDYETTESVSAVGITSVCLSVCSSHWAMLSSIPDLAARLRLWAFKLDYETTESVSAVSIMSVCLSVSHTGQCSLAFLTSQLD